MKYHQLISLFVALFLNGCHSQNTGGCSISQDPINWSTNKYRPAPINDVDVLEQRYTFSGSLQVSTPNYNDNGAGFIEVVTEGNQLVFRTTSNFPLLEHYNARTLTLGAYLSLTRTVILSCARGESAFNFILDVIDTNNNAPTFSQNSYTYVLPAQTSLATLDLTSFGEQILVTDIDFTNQDVTFTVDLANIFTVERVKVDGRYGTYRAVLKLISSTLTQSTNVIITATDSGDPKRSSTTVITLQVEGSVVVPNTPTISEPLYQFQYSVDSTGRITLISIDRKEIIIKTSNPSKIVVSWENGRGDQFFRSVYDITTSKITIGSTGVAVGLLTQPTVVLTLVVALDEYVSKTVVVINFPKENVVGIPLFSAVYYKATYSTVASQHIVLLDDQNDITVSENAVVTIEGDLSDHFSIRQVNNRWQVSVVKNLDAAVIQKGGDIVLTLHARLVFQNTYIYDGYSTLIVNVGTTAVAVPVFSARRYTGVYQISNNVHSVTLDQVITISQSAVVSCRGTHSEYFKIVSLDDTRFSLSIASNLVDLILIQEVDIVLSLQATVNGIVIDEVTLVVQLPKKVAPPRFSRPHYHCRYNWDKDIHTLELSDEIDLIGDNIAETSVSINTALTGYFQISTSRPYRITLIKNLDHAFIISNHEVVITLVASLEGSSLTSTAVVVVQIPDPPKPPHFNHHHYRCRYDHSKETITLNQDDHILTDAKDQSLVRISVEEQWASYLSVRYDVSLQEYRILLLSSFPSDVLTQNEIYVTVQATVDRAIENTYTTLVVQMPSQAISIIPKFSQVFYKGSYVVQQGLVSLSVTQDITIVSDRASETVVKVVDTYADYFKVVLQGGSWKLNLIKVLDDSILLKEKEIVVVLEASLSGVTTVGSSTIVIDLPDRICGTTVITDGTPDNGETEDTKGSHEETNGSHETV